MKKYIEIIIHHVYIFTRINIFSLLEKKTTDENVS